MKCLDSKKLFMPLLVLALAGCRLGTPDGPRHEFTVSGAPQFLTEVLAVTYACKAMALDGYSTNQWRLIRLGPYPTTAPDGTPDKYFCRIYSTNNGSVFFQHDTATRNYIVQLAGSRVICYCHGGL